MAWEDRTPAQQAQADQKAAAYRDSDDDKTYRVTTANGTRLVVQGINSARAVAGKDGTITELKD
jgi:hypothetical protein